jgi:hypothetical protein
MLLGLVDGVILSADGVPVGFAEGYDKDSHFARRVTLLEMPDDSEHGMLEPGDSVVECSLYDSTRRLSLSEIRARVHEVLIRNLERCTSKRKKKSAID